jgi:hypothetical protein
MGDAMPGTKAWRTIKPGQVWEDCDPRMNGRRYVVERVTATHAYLYHQRIPSFKTRLLLRRMRPGSRGWRRVS